MQKLLSLACGLLVAMSLAVVPGVALAALPAEATGAFTTITGYATDIFAAIWPLLAFVVGGFVLIKLFKRGVNKAT